MKRKTTIILQTNQKNLGQQGEIIQVAPGYALNYLIPNEIARLITKGNLKHHQMLMQLDSQKKEEKIIEAIKIQKYLQKITKINIYKTTADKIHLFGSVTDKDIIDKIIKITGINLIKKQISITSVNKIGMFPIEIKIFEEISSIIKLNIIPIDL